MHTLSKIDQKDWKFVPANADKGFSPEHNREVVENSIKKYEATRRKKLREHDEGVQERAKALAFYMRNKGMVISSPDDMEKYFGKSYMNYLKGNIMERIQDGLKVVDNSGRVIRQQGDA